MKRFLSSLLLASLALAQQARITFPKGGDTIRGGQNVTIQVTHAVSTSQMAGVQDVGISIGLSGCAPGSAGCPDPSKDAGRYILYSGAYKPQIHDSGSLDAYQNFTVFIPNEISGVSSIQVGRYWLLTVYNQPTIPTIEYIHSVVNVQPSTAGSYYIHPNGDSAKCVGVLGGAWTNGAAVDIYDCNHSNTQKWQLNGNAFVTVNPADQSKWCLDAGEPASLANGTKMKIWQCYSGLVQQTWTPPFSLSSGGTVRLGGTGNYCLDLTNGDKTNKNVLQVWTCSGGFNANQIWTFEEIV